MIQGSESNVVGLPLGGVSRRTTVPFTASSTRSTPALAVAVESICATCPTVTALPLGGPLITTVTAPAAGVGQQAKMATNRNTTTKPTLARFLSLADIAYLLTRKLAHTL